MLFTSKKSYQEFYKINRYKFERWLNEGNIIILSSNRGHRFYVNKNELIHKILSKK